MRKSAKKSSQSTSSSVNEIFRFDLDQLAKVADGFSGAEIEQALIAATKLLLRIESLRS